MNNINRNIVLIGFMGAGKSEVGRLLSKRAGLNFVDMDFLIEKREGMSIFEIFEKKGESYFRNLESVLVKDFASIAKEDISSANVPWIISAGGGTPVFRDNIKFLKKLGSVVYLKAAAQTLYERIKSENNRPVLGRSGFTQSDIEVKLKEREKFYGKADLTIYTDGLSLEAVVSEIEIFLPQTKI